MCYICQIMHQQIYLIQTINGKLIRYFPKCALVFHELNASECKYVVQMHWCFLFSFLTQHCMRFKYCSFTHARIYSVGHYGLVITIHKHLTSPWIININEHCLILQTFILWPILRMGINTHTSGGSSTVMTTWWHIIIDTIESQFFLQCSSQLSVICSMRALGWEGETYIL